MRTCIDSQHHFVLLPLDFLTTMERVVIILVLHASNTLPQLPALTHSYFTPSQPFFIYFFL